MTEIEEKILIIVLSAVLGFVLSELSNLKRKKREENPEEEGIPEEKESRQMALRNGFGVTRDKNPTFAEQWVNIMNYCGESQTEDGYEEENDYTAGYME